MKHRLPLLFLLVAVVAGLPACGNSSSNITTPTPTPVPTFNGTWTGTATDASGTPLGTGVPGTAGTTTWTLAMTGNQVSGTVAIAGLAPFIGQPTINVQGPVAGNTWTFSMSVPAGAITPLPGCAATINGTLTLATTGDVMTGNYTGTSTCGGAITNGQITLRRQ